MDELKREFLIESQEGLDRMERCLTDFENHPDDATLIAEIFRSVHTIKGTTGFLGYKRLEKLSHAGESLLGQLREGRLSATASIVTTLLKLLDGLRSILRAIEADDTEGAGDDGELIKQLEQFQSTAADPAKVVEPHNSSQQRRRAQRPLTSHEGRGAKSLSKSGLVDVILEQETSSPENAFNTSPSKDTSRKVLPVIVRQEQEAPMIAPASAVAASESTLRVDVTLLNRMMNLVGELVLTRNQVLQASTTSPGLTQLSRRLDMVTSDLREAVMKARMQPVSNVFSKMPRMVRDLSQSLGRKVRLEMEGQDTGLDKGLLEAIKGPLTHAVRNSLDHGIEAPEVRVAAGKSPEGLLRLRAIQEGSHVIIEVSDDGAGISVERVRAKAIERNLISAERAAQQSEHELLQLVFLPGFSTATVITNVSGRGVGMDVVRTNIEKIGGKVELDSHPGVGTTLRLRIPLTLAIIPALIVRSVGQSFALPQTALRELVHIARPASNSAIEWIENTPLYRLRGKLLPLVFLERLLVPDIICKRNNISESYIAVLETDGRRFGLVVDGLADPEEIVVKALNVALKDIGIYSGAAVLGSGNLALILDPTAIAIRSAITVDTTDEHASAEISAPNQQITNEYLIVDIGSRRSAIEFAQVLRIEQIRVSRIEFIGCRPVLNLEGQLLLIEDPGEQLVSMKNIPDSHIVVVVCRNGERQVGLVVSHVVDVAAGAELFETGSSRATEGVTLIDNRVTQLVDVAGSPGLPAIESEHHCCQFQEAVS